jgi:hypothetical protein
MLAGWDFSTTTQLCQGISSFIQPEGILGSFDQLMQATEGVGGVFLWTALLASALAAIWWLLERIRRAEIHFSLMGPLGGAIMFCLIVLPFGAMGAYVGGTVCIWPSIDRWFELIFMIGGLAVGYKLWKRAGST